MPKSALPDPESGAIVKAVVLGIGTQNYTCVDSVPISTGAVAGLYDMSNDGCPYHLPYNNNKIGDHYFTQKNVPTFDLYGAVPSIYFSGIKVANATVRSDSIDWLYLLANTAAPNKGNIKATYRVRTSGGLPSSPCEEDQYIPYMAEYWFYS